MRVSIESEKRKSSELGKEEKRPKMKSGSNPAEKRRSPEGEEE